MKFHINFINMKKNGLGFKIIQDKIWHARKRFHFNNFFSPTSHELT